MNEAVIQSFCERTSLRGPHRRRAARITGRSRLREVLRRCLRLEWRYRQESHILECLDRTDWQGKEDLEIGLGEGRRIGTAESVAGASSVRA